MSDDLDALMVHCTACDFQMTLIRQGRFEHYIRLAHHPDGHTSVELDLESSPMDEGDFFLECSHCGLVEDIGDLIGDAPAIFRAINDGLTPGQNEVIHAPVAD